VLPIPGTESATGLDWWSPELRRAVMVARPAFFAWSAEEQLRYRVKLPYEDREAIVAALLREHGERRPAAVAKLESHGRLLLGLQNRINEWLQPLKGIGEDAFALNDPKVVPLRKTLKVMLHPEALRDMEDDGLL
jgi:hypothetical protein